MPFHVCYFLLTMLPDMRLLQILEQLNAESVSVKDAYGDGRHVR